MTSDSRGPGAAPFSTATTATCASQIRPATPMMTRLRDNAILSIKSNNFTDGLHRRSFSPTAGFAFTASLHPEVHVHPALTRPSIFHSYPRIHVPKVTTEESAGHAHACS